MAKVNPIPQGYHAVTPYLFIKGAARRHRLLQEGFRRHGAHAHAGAEWPGHARRN